MYRVLAVILFCLGAFCLAHAQTGNLDLGISKSVPSGSAPFALDGTPPANASATASSVATGSLTTTYADDIVFVGTSTNSTGVSGISGCSLTWARYPSLTPPTNGTIIDLWYAKASSALGSCSATVSLSSSAFTVVNIFAFSGAHFASPFDSNAALPGTSNTSGTHAACTTTNANDILIGVLNSASGTASSPWTTITSGNFLLTMYQSVSTTQSATQIAATQYSGASICGAIIQGP